MAVRIGFTEYRRQMLEKELARIVSLMPQLGIQKVILTGSQARGETNPGSNLNLVIVQESARGYQYGRREDFFSYHLNPRGGHGLCGVYAGRVRGRERQQPLIAVRLGERTGGL